MGEAFRADQTVDAATGAFGTTFEHELGQESGVQASVEYVLAADQAVMGLEEVVEADRTAFFASVAGRQFAQRYPNRQPNLYQVAQAIYENVSDRAIQLLQLDPSGAGKLRHIDLNDQQRSRFEMIQEGERPEIEATQNLEREQMRELVLEGFSRMPMERIAELLGRHAQRR